jgi:hypothetical protein
MISSSRDFLENLFDWAIGIDIEFSSIRVIISTPYLHLDIIQSRTV